MTTLSRRALLKAGLAIGGGLLVEVSLPSAQAATAPQVFAPNAFLRITSEDVVTFILRPVEMGQGVATSHAQLIAEELGIDPAKMVVEFSPADRRYDHPVLGFQVTGGSMSTPTSWEPYRMAGATAREMMLEAASRSWGVPKSECVAEEGAIHHPPTKRSGRFGQFAEAAARLSVPDVTLRTRDFRVIGKPVPRIDSASKVDGSAVFGIDVQVPEARVAVVVRCPVPGGQVKSFDAAAAKAMSGVEQVVPISSGVAVVGKTYWHARQAAARVKVDWDEGPLATFSTAAMLETHRKLAREGGGKRVHSTGDAEAEFGRAARVLEAEYTAPFVAHAPLEPQNATAHVTDAKCEVWAPTQSPGMLHAQVKKLLGCAGEDVIVHQTWIGGGFGRRLSQEYALEAVEVSRAVGKPVKVIWSREDDMRHSPYRPAATHRVQGALDAHGRLVAWKHTVVTQSILGDVGKEWVHTMFAGAPGFMRALTAGVAVPLLASKDDTAFEGIDTLPYRIPNVAVDFIRHETGVPVLFWRSVGHSHTAFATESFVDEAAHAAGQDPVAFRRELLKYEHRHRWVLELAAEKAGWGTPLPEGRFRGVAVHKSFGSYAAAVAEVSVEDGTIRVHRIVMAADCGRVINPNLVEAQLEGAAVFGLSSALKHHITLEKGRVQQGNFHDFELIRMHESPRIECHIRHNEAPPTGIGEPGVPVIAPAVANAVFAATGKRLRDLPLTLVPAT
ncbi:xanthine dehydrogenase family protein molybdopterin-binding subunit [Hyalangium gracile]|uniref:xanthine dehydrogenase family protein molybdopterin-binding subunit n=1 Tax=Hyalangium gracile TaxID=394092 RepID=UPI0021E12B55|nr:xanthine dehydrogenase family protein molybdopterin-binding subunit [Hyalangium gracile]